MGHFSALISKAKLVKTTQLDAYGQLGDAQLYVLVRDRLKVSEHTLLALLSKEYGIPFKSFSTLIVDPAFFKQFNIEELRKDRLVPVFESSQSACFCIDNPFNPAIALMESRLRKSIKLLLVTVEDMDRVLGQEVRPLDAGSQVEEILTKAIATGGSDLHLFSGPDGIELKIRSASFLRPFMTMNLRDSCDFRQVLKLKSGMDISVHRMPQDGRLTLMIAGKPFDIRVASLPTLHGEDFVCRFFQQHFQSQSLPDLGFSKRATQMVLDCVRHRSGLVLVTGPTGAGKTTTLYQLLHHIREDRDVNVVTLEDPIEKQLPGIRQSQINANSNYTFTTALRAVLRQDPDVIMVGEIRDAETAQVVLNAAYTGHLVLSTLHTPDAMSSLLRLASFDLDPCLLSQCLRGVVCQQLMPKTCECYQKPMDRCPKCDGRQVIGQQLLTEVLATTGRPLLSLEPDHVDEWLAQQRLLSFSDDRIDKKISSHLG